VLQSTRPDRDRPASLRASILPFATIATATLAARLPFLLRSDRFFDADEAVEGLMARHVLAGEHPLFLWGQRYKGVPEIYLNAAVFRVTGSNVVSLKAVTLACFIVFLCVNFRLLERVCSRRVAWIATAFFIAGPPSLVLWTLSGSAEVVMTLLAGAVLLLAIEKWRQTSLEAPHICIAAAALGFGLWIQQYILYYVVSIALTAALVTPGWRHTVRDAVRAQVPAWLRMVLVALTVVAALYIVLGLIAFFTDGIHLNLFGATISVTHPQKMWWVAGTLVAAVIAVAVVCIFRRRLLGPAAAFAIGYLPAVLGRIGNRGMGSPISRLDFAALRASLPDITGMMLPMLFGWRDPTARPTVFPVLALVILLIAVVSYWTAWRREVTPFFHVFPFVAAAMFLVSGSYVDAQSYRYLMPVYAALPVIYAIGIDAIWRGHRAAGSVLLAVAVLTFAAQQIDWYVLLTPDVESRRAIACLEAAGTSVARAGYWQSYKLTFLTGERIIVSPTDGVDRYPPYSALTRDSRTLDQIGCR
jgi:hypothetical protein